MNEIVQIQKSGIEIYNFELKHEAYPYKETRINYVKRHIYDPNKIAKKEIISEIRNQLPNNFKIRNFKDFIGVSFIQFAYPYLNSHISMIKKNNIILPKVTKPDIDNLGKLYLDCVKVCVVNEDCIFYQETIQKIHTFKPYVKIRIELTPRNLHKSIIKEHLEKLKRQDESAF